MVSKEQRNRLRDHCMKYQGSKTPHQLLAADTLRLLDMVDDREIAVVLLVGDFEQRMKVCDEESKNEDFNQDHRSFLRGSYRTLEYAITQLKKLV